MLVKAGSTDVSVEVFVADAATGAPATGLAFNSSGIDLKYRRTGAAAVDITEATLAALTTAHTDGGFKEIGFGYYRLDLPDAAVAASAAMCLVLGTITGYVVYGPTIQLVAFDPADTVRLGLTALPNVASGSAGAIITSGTGTAQLSVSSGIAKADLDTIKTQTVTCAAGVTVLASVGTAATSTAQTGDVFARVTGTGAVTFASLTVSGATTLTGALTSTNSSNDLRGIDVRAISGDITAADNAESFFDGTGYAGTNNVIPLVTTTTTATTATNVTTVNGLAANVITAASIASGAITGAKVASDVTIASVVGAVGSVTGNVGGNVGGNVSGSVGSVASGGIASTSFASGAINAAAIAPDAIGASELAADAVAEIVAGVWNELQSGHTTAGTFGKYLDSAVSGVSTGGVSATDIANAVWDALRSAHVVAGSFGLAIDATISSRMASYTQPTGFLAATFPTTVASTTNITGGVITTVTNLTNAPGAGDLTTTMKNSVVTAAASALTSYNGLKADTPYGIETTNGEVSTTFNS